MTHKELIPGKWYDDGDGWFLRFTHWIDEESGTYIGSGIQVNNNNGKAMHFYNNGTFVLLQDVEKISDPMIINWIEECCKSKCKSDKPKENYQIF